MSLVNQEKESQEFVSNPCKKFLTVKGVKEETEVTKKDGTKKIISELVGAELEYQVRPEEEGGEWTKESLKLPLEFIIIDDSWFNFKGWNEDEGMYYRSNEVNSSDRPILIRDKEKVVYEFTMDDYWGNIKGSKMKDEETAKATKGKLKALNVSEHGSIYVALKKEDGTFELVNLQLKTTNLRGSKDHKDAGWRKFSKKMKDMGLKYKNFVQINDWTTGTFQEKDFVILNYTIGDKITQEELDQAIELGKELEAYHNQYLNKPQEEEVRQEADEESSDY